MTRIALLAMSLFASEAVSKSPGSIGTISPLETFHFTNFLYPPAPPLENIQSSPSYSWITDMRFRSVLKKNSCLRGWR